MRALDMVLGEVVGIGLVALALGLASHSFTLVRVDGASMTPALSLGDLVLVAKRDQVTQGDIIWFRLEEDGRSTLHRVKATTGGGLITAGDANPVADRRAVPRDRVLGRVRLVIPFGVLGQRVRERLGAG